MQAQVEWRCSTHADRYQCPDALIDYSRQLSVECRIFAGLTIEETAGALGTSIRTVQREWTTAHA
jgi:hypothetical protein